jgi:hypothetical protein
LAEEKNLQKLLQSISPALRDGEYVFCTVVDAQYGDYAEAEPIASCNETEGLTLVLLKEAADRSGLSYQGIFRCITLGVHSSLQAVGLTAVVAAALAENGISANIIAGYFHDHIFVASENAADALGILLKLAK